jgi:hypothetical protein
MNKEDFWRNFSLNRELHVSGGFIYDGMRELRTLQTFGNADEVFQVVYPLAVGFERFLKIAIVLLEYRNGMDPAQFEKSLISHNHLELLRRVKNVKRINLGPEHNGLLQILGRFYKSYRYDRFSIQSVFTESSETADLLRYLSKYIRNFEGRYDSFGDAPHCSDEVRDFVAKVCAKLCSGLYKIIEETAMNIHLFTYELRVDSKAWKVFLSQELGFHKEDLLWKEILIYLMNTKHDTRELRFLRGIEPLDFDPGMIPDYLECLASDVKKIAHIDEMEEIYTEIKDAREREDIMDVIGGGPILLDDDDDDGGKE